MKDDWRELVSQAKYQAIREDNVKVKMRDGVRLSVNIFRPKAEGRFPALLALSPYGKETQSMQLQPQPPSSTRWRGYLEAGNTEYLVSRGYAHIIGDIRGTGQSEGECCNLLSKQEAQDGYDIIEWIAQQPWSDGKIGMIGISYFAMVQLIVAGEQPPHLKALFAYDTPADIYRHGLYDGGILSLFYMRLWPLISGRNCVSYTIKSASPEELNRLIEQAKANPDITSKPEFYNLLVNPRQNPFLFDFLVHPTDGPLYWERSGYKKYENIKIPVYCGSGWYAYTYLHLAGAFQNYIGLKGPKKMIIGPPAALERPFHQYHDLIVRWFDHWLKGMDTGIMDEPPIKLFVMGANKWRYEEEWPLTGTNWTKFYLRSWGRLSREPEECGNISPDCFVQQPLTVTENIQSLVYMTSPLSEDTEVTGPIALYLYASINTDDTNWIVALKDLDSAGAGIELTRGWLKASHRALDEDKSKPYQPYHTHLNPQSVVPEEIGEYAIEMRPTSNVFRKGHRIRLEIMSADLPGKTIIEPDHLSSSRTTLHSIYHDKEHRSHLLLPIISSDRDSRWVPGE